jgi:microcystin-dependent protein
MATPFIGEIRMFGGNFAPAGWAFCNGQLLPIAENEALFQLIGTIYGGDGQSTFALPDLRGRVPIHRGTNPGAGAYVIGQAAGSETVTLSPPQMPSHVHAVAASSAAATSAAGPGGNAPAMALATPFYSDGAPAVQMSPAAIGVDGGNQPHENMAPYLCINFIIALFGIFPSQT